MDHIHHQLAERGLVGLADELLLADAGGPLQRLLIVLDQTSGEVKQIRQQRRLDTCPVSH